MKIHYPITAALALLTLNNILPAQTPAPAAEPQVAPTHPAPTITPAYYHAMTAGTTMRIDFCVPMVKESEIGKPVSPGYFHCSHADAVSATWVSPSSILLKITRDMPPMEMLRLSTPEGLRGLGGEVLAAHTVDLYTYKDNLFRTNEYTSTGTIFLRPAQADFAALARKKIQQLCYEFNGKRHPLSYRPATVADALAHWDAFDELCFYNLSSHDKEEMSHRPADEVLPDIWVAEAPGIAPSGQKVKIILPEVGWSYSRQCNEDHIIRTISAPYLDYELTNTCKDKGLFEVSLTLDMPAATENAEELTRSLKWSIREDAHSDCWQTLEWKDGALRGKVRGKDIVITPTATDVRPLQLLGGSEVRGLKALTLTAETGGREIRLKVEGNYQPVSTPLEQSEALNDNTMLRPGMPYIYTDLTASHLQLRGTTTLRCRYGQLKNGTASIKKLSTATPADAIRLLRNYHLYYNGNDNQSWALRGKQEEEREKAGLKDTVFQDNKVDSSALPGVIATVERPLQPGARQVLTLRLNELFNEPSAGGFYFVEIEGTPLRESKHPVINQGIVQVTDLGLLWKTNGRHLFARAYHLGTADDLQEATLKLYDENGELLSELAVRNGLAEGDWPPTTRYLQLSTADDSVIIPYTATDFELGTEDDWRNGHLMDCGVCPADIARPLVYIFSDRELYRPGEVAHLKGIARWVKNNQLSTPDIESISARISRQGQLVDTLPATLGADGTFSIDLTVHEPGSYYVTFHVKFKGDDDNTSPDKSLLSTYPALENVLDDERAFSYSLTCKEFRRNEFEVQSAMNVQAAERRVQLTASATNFNTTPVAGGKVHWSLVTEESNFYPQQAEWRDFRFGDFTENPWEHFYHYSGYNSYRKERNYLSQEGHLNDEGKGSASFTLPGQNFPKQRCLISTATVTNGNEQSLRSVQKEVIHPADVYVGIRTQATLAKVGGTLPVQLVAVKPDGTAWDGAPLNADVKLTRTIFRPYRYGSASSSDIRNSEESSITHSVQTTLSGTPTRLEFPVDKAGRYDIVVSGTDSSGREFRSATRHYVWGDDVSPWEYLDSYNLNLVADKAMYHPGDTAAILVETPVDAELLITVERDKVLRHYRRSVTVDRPVIEIPIEATDAPVVYLSVSLVQNDSKRSSDGMPRVLLNSCPLLVATPDKELAVALQAPEKALRPGAPCTVSGTITDRAGRPVPHADVTLYAEDEGTLQVIGYDLPNPHAYFYSQRGRAHMVNNYSGQGHLVGENLRHRDYGNKGVFIGGGDDSDFESEGNAPLSDDEQNYLRNNFNPCALWLANVRTDEKGQFSTTYSNPDTLTRYRLMAVAAAGDKFGAAQSSYKVNKPIMLEPVAPMSATEGDELMLPVTVSMLPDQLPPGSSESLSWQVTLSGSNVDIPVPTQSVTLNGNQPATLFFPITVKQAAPTQLQWQVQASDTSQHNALAAMKDAVQLSFDAIPPTPHLREYIWAELKNAQSAGLSNWLHNSYRAGSPVQLTMSTSPLAGLGYPMQYLFTYPYGCTEQLSSTVLPWILKDDLQKALGVNFPTEFEAQAVISKVMQRLQSRQLSVGKYSYWDNGSQASEFSPYVLLIKHLIGQCSGQELAVLHADVQNAQDNGYLSLLVLALCNDIRATDVDAMLAHAGKTSKLTPEQRWVLAYCAAAVQHARAAELQREAAAATSSALYSNYNLPPVQALMALYAILTDCSSPTTAKMMRDYLKSNAGQYSTWRNAWMVLTVHAYTKKAAISKRLAKVNGTTISSENPLQLTTTTDCTSLYSAVGNPVYISGLAEGYLSTQQPQQSINQGFDVQRRYEKLHPDGSWVPTGSFTVGDIVRVTVYATSASSLRNLRYLVMEDRLPACFEAVDPALSSQALPQGVSADALRMGYYFPIMISNREFLKDRVRVFADWVGSGEQHFSYVARVVRSGKVTAPAAKAELMYTPEIYGLSIPQQFEVKAR